MATSRIFERLPVDASPLLHLPLADNSEGAFALEQLVIWGL
jgi:hypothetical protein